MEKEFCTYKQALALKELGFDEPCIAYYFSDSSFNDAAEEDDTLHPGDPRFYSDTNRSLSAYTKDELKYNSVTAPLYQQAFRWFREKYHLVSYIRKNEEENYDHEWIIDSDEDGESECRKGWSYEEAEQACLDKLIEIVKKQDNDK